MLLCCTLIKCVQPIRTITIAGTTGWCSHHPILLQHNNAAASHRQIQGMDTAIRQGASRAGSSSNLPYRHTVFVFADVSSERWFRALMTNMVPGNTEVIIADNVRYVRLVIEKTLRLAGVASPSATEGASTHVVSTLSQRRWKLPPVGAISQCISKYRFTASSSCSGCSMIS